MATAAATLGYQRITRGRRPRLLGRLLVSALTVGTLAPLAGVQLAAALNPATTGGGQGFVGAPTIASRSTGDLSSANLAPGATTTGYTTVRLGDASAEVGLHATVDEGGLERYIDVRIAQGAGGRGTFRAERVVFEGTLARLPRTAAGAIDLGTWRAGAEHTFRVVTMLRDTNAAQGLSTSVDLAFTATTNAR